MSYFGKGCIHLSGIWMNEYYFETDIEQDYEPQMKYCTHIQNQKKVENNCNLKLCPIDKCFNYTFKMPEKTVV